MKRVLIVTWLVVTLAVTFIMDYWVRTSLRSLEHEPPSVFLYSIIAVLGLGSLLFLFWYLATLRQKDSALGLGFVLTGLLIMVYPLASFYLESIQVEGLGYSARSPFWHIGVIVFLTGAFQFLRRFWEQSIRPELQ